MQINQENTGAATATIEIIIGKADYEPKVDKALKEYQRKAAMPGFRPGKVPFGMVRKMYGSAVLAEQINKLVSDSLNEYIYGNKIRLLGYPLPDAERTGQIDFEGGNDLHFFFEVGLAPEIDIDFSSLTENYIKVNADEKEIQKVVDNMLKEYPETTYPEDVAENDQLVLKVVQADADGNEVEEGIEKEVQLDLKKLNEDGKKSFIGKTDGAEFIVNFEQILGKEEATSLLELGEESEAIANSNFNVIITDIKREIPAELNEDFFNRMFPDAEITTEEEFKARIGQEIEKQFDQQSNYLFFNEVLEKLINETPIELPETFLKKWMVDNSDGKITMEQAEDDFKKYSKSIRFELIEGALKEKYPEELHVSQQEMRQHVMSYFMGQFMGQMELTKELEMSLSSTVDNILKNEKEASRIERQLTEQKMIKLFNEKVTKVEDIKTPEEFNKFIEERNKSQEDEINE